jgi:glycine/D-amino acid oxidase-like deaminating enzyme
LDRQPTGFRVTSSAGTVEARDVLLATNGYTNGAAPELQRRFIPIGSYIIATEPLDASTADALLPRRRMAFDSKNFLYYFRVTGDRRLLFGGRAEFGRPDPESTRRAAGILRSGMVEVFPQLARARIDYAWSGNVAFTRDQMPRAGLLDGMYYAGGYCGHGVAMATHLGEAIARRIAGEQITHPFFDDRFAAIPMYSGTPWFLPLVGAYYQVKDWLQ